MRSFRLTAVAFAIAACTLAAPRFADGAEYHWNGSGSTSWTIPSNWTPSRSIAATNDRLVFDNGATLSVTGVTTQTIGQLVVSNGTKLTLNAGQPGNTVTVSGGTGPDLEVTAGSTLFLDGLNALVLNLATGSTAAIGGNFTVLNATHRLQALDANAITFTSGSIATASTGFSGSLFGLGTGPSALNSVRFQAGSVYAQLAGANPFGAAQPNSVVIFEPGSLFRLDASIAPTMSGRNYANFEYNGPASIIGSGSGACSIDSLVLNSGTISIELTGTLSLRGSIRTRGASVLQLGPTSGNVNYRLNGTATQLLVDSSTVVSGRGINFRPSVKLTIDNPAGVEMNPKTLHTLPGILEFVHGIATMSLDLGSTGSVLGASASTGWVNGPLRAKLPPGNPSRTLQVGTPTAYQPIDLRLNTVPDSIRISAVAFPKEQVYGWPYRGTQLDSLTLVQSLFLVAVIGSGTFTNFDAVFHYSSPDYPPGSDPGSFVARLLPFDFLVGTDPNTGWRSTTTGVRTPTSIEVLGATRTAATDNNFYFLVGDPSIVRVSVFDSSKVEGTGPMFPLKFRVALSEPAVDPVTVDYTTVAGSALPGSDYGTTLSTLTFAPGTTSFHIPVPIIADATPEADETFSFALSNSFRAVLDRATATGTIVDDDDVTPPSVTVLSPNGGESVIQGANVNLDWTASDNVAVETVDLYLSRDDGATWESIATGLANNGSYPWVATAPLTQLARLKVVASDHHLQSGEDASDAAWAITTVSGVSPVLPTSFALDLASANPARGASRIRYALPRDQHVRLALLDVRGRVVSLLRDGAEPAGVHEVIWDGRTATGVAAAGIYFVQIRAGEWNAERKLVRVR